MPTGQTARESAATEIQQIPPERERERQWYINWLVYSARQLDSTVEVTAVSELLKQKTTFDLIRLYRDQARWVALNNAQWGVEGVASASSEQRRAVIDSILWLDTSGSADGTELPPLPSAGGMTTEAPILWARDRRKRLETMPPEELAVECVKVLETERASADRSNTIMALARSKTSQQMRELVNLRYDYSRSLIEVARYYRQLKVKSKQVATRLAATPFKCTDGATVTFEDGYIVVNLGEELLGKIKEQQFAKRYWKQGKFPVTS